ncbi:hypothetical protein LF25067_01483 [Limosilactobacillus fermentum]|nr:hypothetical protein [Limosilactobacillus fermentum]BAW87153.1 hypothetical protein LF25067_01483 [Limosilactobacillus fermentum]
MEKILAPNWGEMLQKPNGLGTEVKRVVNLYAPMASNPERALPFELSLLRKVTKWRPIENCLSLRGNKRRV